MSIDSVLHCQRARYHSIFPSVVADSWWHYVDADLYLLAPQPGGPVGGGDWELHVQRAGEGGQLQGTDHTCPGLSHQQGTGAKIRLGWCELNFFFITTTLTLSTHFVTTTVILRTHFVMTMVILSTFLYIFFYNSGGLRNTFCHNSSGLNNIFCCESTNMYGRRN